MKKNYIVTALVAACALLTTSCSTMVDGNNVSANKVGYGAQAFPATVVAAKNVNIETTSTARNLPLLVAENFFILSRPVSKNVHSSYTGYHIRPRNATVFVPFRQKHPV